jgi:hypothetical protein
MENAAPGHRDKRLVRTVTSRFKKPPGYECPFKIEVCNSFTPVGNLYFTERV